jgi:hypothetical protein
MEEWYPEEFIKIEKIQKNFALVILNRPVIGDNDLIRNLWTNGKNH